MNLEKMGNFLESKNCDLIELCTPDKAIWLRIKVSALKSAYRICTDSGHLEVGGSLIGSYSQNKATCTIHKFLPPTPDSKKGKYNFELGIVGLREIFEKFWKKKQFYVGDWHFHPRSAATPSLQDLSQLKIISESSNLKCASPVMIIIGEETNSFTISATVHLKDNGPQTFELY